MRTAPLILVAVIEERATGRESHATRLDAFTVQKRSTSFLRLADGYLPYLEDPRVASDASTGENKPLRTSLRRHARPTRGRQPRSANLVDMAAPTDSRPPDATLHRIDVATFVRLGELGVYPTRSELVDGIVYDLSPKGDPHFLAQSEIIEQLVLAGRGRYRVGAEPTLKVDEQNGPMPDVLVVPRNAAISPGSADLVIEVADTSLEYDRGRKRTLYAAVREYWIVDLQHELVERYLPANADSPTIVRSNETLAPAAYSDVTIDLSAVFAAARQGRR